MTENRARLTPEYRRCPISGRWVIVAPLRATRPMVLDHASPHARNGNHAEECPFCEGHEDQTPGELFALRSSESQANQPGWQLRVCPNKYPAVLPFPGELQADRSGYELFQSLPGHGVHELIIECPRHEANPIGLSEAEFVALLQVYRHRLLALSNDPRNRYVSIFKNVGAEAGASLAHLHSQVVATPFVPEAVNIELLNGEAHFARTGRCLFCDLIEAERSAKVRVILETTNFIAICPYAPRFGYEVWLFPLVHENRYEQLSNELCEELARLMKRLLQAVDFRLGRPAYNWHLHTAPVRSESRPDFHWHIELTPRTSRPAGFEWGSGCYITTVPPERAAAELRLTIAEQTPVEG